MVCVSRLDELVKTTNAQPHETTDLLMNIYIYMNSKLVARMGRVDDLWSEGVTSLDETGRDEMAPA